MFSVMIFFIAVISAVYMSKQFKKCPLGKVLLIFNNKNRYATPQIIRSGKVFVNPFNQSYVILPATSMKIGLSMKDIPIKDTKKIDFSANLNIELSKKTTVLANAKNLSGLNINEAKNLTQDLIKGLIKIILANKQYDEICKDKENFSKELIKYINVELTKLGLEITNISIENIEESSEAQETSENEISKKVLNQEDMQMYQDEETVTEIDRSSVNFELKYDKNMNNSTYDKEI